ncbi:MAG TPA: hypothetical protein VIX20_14400 [Ktedonobacteraceae bacterium]
MAEDNGVPTVLLGPSACICPDDTCTKLGCVAPNPNWWKSHHTRHCDLVVDPEFGITLTGTVYGQVRECTGTAIARVIDIDDDWVIDVHITVQKNLSFICGHWCVSACLESMCGPKYYRFPHDSADSPYCCCLVETNQFATDYDISICVPAGKIAVDECGAPYELTVIVTLLSQSQIKQGDKCDPGTYMPLGVATACELPLMTFYDGG